MDDELKIAALVGTAAAFFAGLFQYRKTQQWKRVEWVAQEMKVLMDSPLVQSALVMIDWNARKVFLNPDGVTHEERFVRVNDDMVSVALRTHDDGDRFTPEEVSVRGAFDQLLDGIERFSSYECTGLVKVSDIQPYLQYWADNICRPHGNSEKRLDALHAYMKRYGYHGARRLLTRISVYKQQH